MFLACVYSVTELISYLPPTLCLFISLLRNSPNQPSSNPYVDVLNVLQVEALRRIRNGDVLRTSKGNIRMAESKAMTEDALLVTINGIAAGMRNSG